MPFKIADKVYPLPGEAGTRSITLEEQRLIEREFRRPLEKVMAVTNMTEKQFKSLPEDKQDEMEVQRREVALIMLWIARMRAGENLSFSEACDVEADQLSEVQAAIYDDPKDDQ
jgi:hypothetical protein